MPRSVLILGPTGRLGRNAAQAFAAAGWSVTPFDRKTGNLMAEARGKADKALQAGISGGLFLLHEG